MSARCVGVDAGGTETVAVASHDGTIVGHGRGGAANASSKGTAAAATAIVRAVDAALAGSGLASLYVGAAGAGRARIGAELAANLATTYPAAHIVVRDDTEIALRAAIPSGPGIVLIAGTGSIAYAENGERTARVGGAGHAIGDEGSGFAIGAAALRTVMRAFEGRTSDDATIAIVGAVTGAHDPVATMDYAYGPQGVDVAAVAAIAPAVLAAANSGNRACTKIVQAAASDLGDLVTSAAKLVGLSHASPRVALSGGLFRENSILSFLLETRLTGDIPGVDVIRGPFDPALAALRLAEAPALGAR